VAQTIKAWNAKRSIFPEKRNLSLGIRKLRQGCENLAGSVVEPYFRSLDVRWHRKHIFEHESIFSTCRPRQTTIGIHLFPLLLHEFRSLHIIASRWWNEQHME
jgi:hypothetical protein